MTNRSFAFGEAMTMTTTHPSFVRRWGALLLALEDCSRALEELSTAVQQTHRPGQLHSRCATHRSGCLHGRSPRPFPRAMEFRGCRWDELSVHELRSLLRSYPIDRHSLPAPIELMRREELLEALSQIESLTA